MATERQVKANRANALLSTGPRTPEGKAVSSRNALRHGILAREAIIDDGDGRENLEEYESLLAGLMESLMPVGEMERLLVEKIAAQHWRLRRVLRFETGCLRAELDDHRREAEREASLDETSMLFPSAPKPKLTLVWYGDPITEAEAQAHEALSVALAGGSGSFEEDDRVLEAVFRHRLGRAYGGGALPGDWRNTAKAYLTSLDDRETRKLRKALVKSEQDLAMQMREVLEFNRKVERRARWLSLPSRGEIDLIVRYQTAIERSIARDLEMLMKLQGIRRRQHEDESGNEAAGPPEAPRADVQATEAI